MIKSVLDQNYKDFELILVDDCSTDDTVQKIKEHQNIDNRIKLIQLEEHSGFPGTVRNRGIEAATGTWLYFVDHDDAIMPDTLQTLMATAEETDAPVLYMCDWYTTNDINFSDVNTVEKVTKVSSHDPVANEPIERIEQELCNHSMGSTPWLFCFKRDLGLKFPENVLAEDICLHLKILKEYQITKITGPHYIHCQHDKSITGSLKYFKEGLLAVVHFAQFCNDLFKDMPNGYSMADYVTYNIARSICTVYVMPYMLQEVITDSELDQQVKDLFTEEDRETGCVFVYGYLHELINSMKMSSIVQAAISQIIPPEEDTEKDDFVKLYNEKF